MSETPRIYLIPGMTPDYPVYARVKNSLPNSSVLDFIQPFPSESLSDYADRISQGLSPESVVVGVSFGGMLALEIARNRSLKACVLISSLRDPSQLPPWFRVFRSARAETVKHMLRCGGTLANALPKRLSTQSSVRMRKLAGPTGDWYQWATTAVLKWEPCPVRSKVLQIHGTADGTFPIRYVEPDVRIIGGGHALPVSHPRETVEAILGFLQTA